MSATRFLIAEPIRVLPTDTPAACGGCGRADLFCRPEAQVDRAVLCMGCALERVKQGADFDVMDTPMRLIDALEFLAAASSAEVHRQAALGGH